MATTIKQTAFRLTAEDLAILDAATRRSGQLSRNAALRYVLRFWADATGLDVDKLVKRKPTPKRRK